MGANGSKLPSDNLLDMSKNTNFSKRELSKWNAGFTTDYTSGVLTQMDFERIFKSWFPFGDSKKLSNYIFSKFDTNNDQMVDFQEFIMILSLMGRGSFEDKLRVIFGMYDMDEDGYIGRAELEYLIELQTRALGELSSSGSERAQFLFDRFDADKDGRISFDEFRTGIAKDDYLVGALNLYDGLL